MSQTAEALKVSAALAGDENEFRSLVEPHRRELLAHCYRMLGTPFEAEDLVQETFLRAWRHLAGFRGASSFRSWLYKIATNVSLDLVATRRSRLLPTETHAPADSRLPVQSSTDSLDWLEPIPDALLGTRAESAEQRFADRESVALAFLVALQRLPGRQRAVLLLRDVLGWPATEAAEVLDVSVSTVESLLFRARATLGPVREGARLQPSDEDERTLLARYVRTWESGDVGALVALLREEATMAMPPVASWYLGRDAIRDFILATIFALPGSAVRLLPIAANRQPAFAFYCRRGNEAPFTLLGVQLLTLEGDAIAGITTFVDPSIAPRFGLSPSTARSPLE